MQSCGYVEYFVPDRGRLFAIFGDLRFYSSFGLGQLGDYPICHFWLGAGRFIWPNVGAKFEFGGDWCGHAAFDAGRRYLLILFP